MRLVLQRVRRAAVAVEGETIGSIGSGLLLFLGIEKGDGVEDVAWLCRKIPRLRLFEDDAGRMNRSLLESGGGVLLISQFTLCGSIRKGNRPSFNDAADPPEAIPLYERFQKTLAEELGGPVAAGRFGAYMLIEAENDGPVTLFLDTRRKDFL